MNGSLHHFDFANLDPTVADINMNLSFYHHWYDDIYNEIGQKLDYLFSRFKLNICFSDNMHEGQLGGRFLILNHDCAFSNSKEDSRTGEHWKMTDQRWKVPTKYNIPENNYYCYNLQLVNLYNHTSLTFACNVCNFDINKVYTPYFQNKYGSYKWDNGHILPNNVAYFGVDSSNTNNYFIPSKFFKKVLHYFIVYYCISFNYSFWYTENGHYCYPEYGHLIRHFYDYDEIIGSPEHVHFSEEDWLTEDGNSGHFDRSKVHNLTWSKWNHFTRHPFLEDPWDACLEYALFTNLYLTKNGGCAWVIAGGAWKNVDHFPDKHSSIYWQIHLSITNIRIAPIYHGDTLSKHRINSTLGWTDYSDFIQLDRQPDYILTSENELYWFYRSSVTFNFFNTDLINQVLMKKVNEGINQTLVLNHDYTLTKKAGCYQFLVTFHDYPYEYYGFHYGKTITLNIRIIPDYDFSQGLNAVTLNYFSRYHDENYAPATYSDDYWVVDIYLDRKTISRFYHWLSDGPSIKTKFLSFFNKSIFKNACSLVGNLNLKKSINSFFSEKDLYKCLDKEITHRHDDIFTSGLKKVIFFVVKNNNSGHLHFILKKYPWTVLNDNGGEYNTGHFYDKIVQLD